MLDATLNADSMEELLVAGGNHDIIPTLDVNMLLESDCMAAGADDKWGAGEGGIPVADSKGVIQFCEEREEVEGEGGMGGVPGYWRLLPGENGADSAAMEVWSVSMTARGDPDELGALPERRENTPSF